MINDSDLYCADTTSKQEGCLVLLRGGYAEAEDIYS